MKKLVFLSLLMVAASGYAKEVVPAPVVVTEAPVQIVEKEVIVYKEKEPEWKPNGYVNVLYKYWGRTETKNEDVDWANSSNNFARVQLRGSVNLTPKQKLYFRVRNQNDYDKETKFQHTYSDNTRIDYSYKFGKLGDSKVNTTGKLQYYKWPTSQRVEAYAYFDFAEYMINNDFIKTTNFSIVPSYRYYWANSNDENYYNRLTIGLESNYDLPLGFSAEIDIYGRYHKYGQEKINYYPFDKKACEVKKSDGTLDEEKTKENIEKMQELNIQKQYDDDFSLDVELYLYQETNLYKNDKLNVDFYFEGGIEESSYTWSKNRYVNYGESKDNSKKDHFQYSAYMSPEVNFGYKLTNDVKLYGGIGAEYRNWQKDNSHNAKNWRWQPFVYTGVKVTF